jgi:hypothetical protein
MQLSNFMKIRPMGAESFHVGRQTDMKKLILAFHNFANMPKSECVNTSYVKNTCVYNADQILIFDVCSDILSYTFVFHCKWVAI